MTRDEIIGLLRRDVTPELYRQIRDEWKRHSIAEDRRDIAGLLSTLTPDCVYEIVGTSHVWHGHDGAAQFYQQLLGAFPDITFELTHIVIGPQGVSEEASVRATHSGVWLGVPPTGKRVHFTVLIFFPWDLERGKFKGERIFHTFVPA